MKNGIAHVSYMRFRKYGFARTLFIYARLSFLFAICAFRLANRMDYRFAEYWLAIIRTMRENKLYAQYRHR